MPFGAHTLLARYERAPQRAPDCRHAWMVALWKRTFLYVSDAHVTNRNGAAYHTENATLPPPAQPDAVGGTSEVNADLAQRWPNSRQAGEAEP